MVYTNLHIRTGQLGDGSPGGRGDRRLQGARCPPADQPEQWGCRAAAWPGWAASPRCACDAGQAEVLRNNGPHVEAGPRQRWHPWDTCLPVARRNFRNPSVAAADQGSGWPLCRRAGPGATSSSWCHDDRIGGERRCGPVARASAMCDVHEPIMKFMRDREPNEELLVDRRQPRPARHAKAALAADGL